MSQDRIPDDSVGALIDRFIEPPFTVLDTKTGRWKNGVQRWKQLGIKSELGRDAKTFNMGTKANAENGWQLEDNLGSGVSVFDPYLCEIMYTWFCPPNGKILDPFAGGSVRGIVANKLGFNYTGIDLRHEQILANQEQGLEIIPHHQPTWIAGDSNVELDKLNEQFDFVFSCPPYADLEVYSDHEDDLSTMEYQDFVLAYRSIINKSIRLLKPGHLAVFVVGDVRDKDGYFYDFISDTKKAFIDSGAKLYNEAVLLNAIASAALRANGNMESKKLVKTHQNILCFKKTGNDSALKNKIVLDYINKCTECGGRIRRTASGRICEECMTEY